MFAEPAAAAALLTSGPATERRRRIGDNLCVLLVIQSDRRRHPPVALSGPPSTSVGGHGFGGSVPQAVVDQPPTCVSRLGNPQGRGLGARSWRTTVVTVGASGYRWQSQTVSHSPLSTRPNPCRGQAGVTTGRLLGSLFSDYRPVADGPARTGPATRRRGGKA